ncbi:DUF1080 domain-containing protein [Candidatus Poribacteria bacterium]|nr:DUF1080 domain-containing protein [Candidatus Poribacteria bacterium]
MKFIGVLCIFLVTIPALAGTFRDDFNHNKLNDWIFENFGGKVDVKDGKVIIIDNDPGIASALVFNNYQDNIRNFVLTVDAKMVRQIDNKTWDYLCVMSRGGKVGGIDTCLWMSIEAIERRIPLVVLTSPIQGLQQFGGKDLPFAFQIDKWYTIRLEVNKDKITVEIDGKFIGENEWPNQPMLCERGYVAIGAGGAEVHFDNFMITGDEIQDNSKSIGSKDKIATLWGKIRK